MAEYGLIKSIGKSAEGRQLVPLWTHQWHTEGHGAKNTEPDLFEYTKEKQLSLDVVFHFGKHVSLVSLSTFSNFAGAT